jgi:hypothetical protein
VLNATSFSSSYRTSIYIGSFGGGAVVDTKERRAQRDSREKPSELRHNSTKSGFFSGTQKDVNLSLFRDSTNIEMKKWNCCQQKVWSIILANCIFGLWSSEEMCGFDHSGPRSRRIYCHRGQVWNGLVNLKAWVRIPSRTSFHFLFQNKKVKPIANPAV